MKKGVTFAGKIWLVCIGILCFPVLGKSATPKPIVQTIYQGTQLTLTGKFPKLSVLFESESNSPPFLVHVILGKPFHYPQKIAEIQTDHKGNFQYKSPPGKIVPGDKVTLSFYKGSFLRWEREFTYVVPGEIDIRAALQNNAKKEAQLVVERVVNTAGKLENYRAQFTLGFRSAYQPVKVSQINAIDAEKLAKEAGSLHGQERVKKAKEGGGPLDRNVTEREITYRFLNAVWESKNAFAALQTLDQELQAELQKLLFVHDGFVFGYPMNSWRFGQLIVGNHFMYESRPILTDTSYLMDAYTVFDKWAHGEMGIGEGPTDYKNLTDEGKGLFNEFFRAEYQAKIVEPINNAIRKENTIAFQKGQEMAKKFLEKVPMNIVDYGQTLWTTYREKIVHAYKKSFDTVIDPIWK